MWRAKMDHEQEGVWLKPHRGGILVRIWDMHTWQPLFSFLPHQSYFVLALNLNKNKDNLYRKKKHKHTQR